MMIFPLHCYSTAAMPYMGAQGGGDNSRCSPLSGYFFSKWVFLHIMGAFFSMWWAFFLPCGGYKQGALSSCGGPLFSLGRNGGGGGVESCREGGGIFGIVLL